VYPLSTKQIYKINEHGSALIWLSGFRCGSGSRRTKKKPKKKRNSEMPCFCRKKVFQFLMTIFTLRNVKKREKEAKKI